MALVLSVLGLGLGTATALADANPPSAGPFAAFLACMKAHGAPTLGHPGGNGQSQGGQSKGSKTKSDRGKKDDHGKNDNGMPPGGKPGFGRHGRSGWPGALSDADRAALKAAFTACSSLLPKPTHTAAPPGLHPGPRFTLPSHAQLQAFATCMAGKGFSMGKPGSGPRPDFRDPAVRTALRAALKACAPQLKPASS